LSALAYNGVGTPAAAGILYTFSGIRPSPTIAAAMAASSLSVVTNATRLRRYHPALLPAEAARLALLHFLRTCFRVLDVDVLHCTIRGMLGGPPGEAIVPPEWRALRPGLAWRLLGCGPGGVRWRRGCACRW